jgi:hypothetical protein
MLKTLNRILWFIQAVSVCIPRSIFPASGRGREPLSLEHGPQLGAASRLTTVFLRRTPQRPAHAPGVQVESIPSGVVYVMPYRDTTAVIAFSGPDIAGSTQPPIRRWLSGQMGWIPCGPSAGSLS